MFDKDNPRFQNRPNLDPSLAGQQASAEDTYAEYTDLDPTKHNWGESPLGIKIIERTYKWKESVFYNFIIYDYQIINIGLDTDGDLIPDVQQNLRDVHVGMRIDSDISTLAAGEYWYDDLVAYDSLHSISYIFDGDDPDRLGNDEGEYGISQGYLYARFLKGAGGTPYISYTKPVSHTWWTIDDDPNPFVGSSHWERKDIFEGSAKRVLAFTNLPSGKSTIKIFTLAGDLINTLEHTTGESICFWDMTNKKGRSIVSGIYLYTLESKDGTKIDKFVVLE